MPFQKGREKTGGRKKGGLTRKSTKLVDQLKDHGFNYVKEMAAALKELPAAVTDPKAYQQWLVKYNELKSLLPYMAPKLREKEVELIDPVDHSAVNPSAISDEDLMKALEHGNKEKTPKSRATRGPEIVRPSVLPEPPQSTLILSEAVDETE